MADVLPGIGKLITDGTQGRDAIHIAVIPMKAVMHMHPGTRLVNGIVDPFLRSQVNPGEWFWLFLYPNTTTSLRHVWSHPAFPAEESPCH